MQELCKTFQKLCKVAFVNKSQFYSQNTIMSETDLHELPIDALLELLRKSTEELVYFNCTEHDAGYKEKRIEVQLIQKLIVAKRAEFAPLV